MTENTDQVIIRVALRKRKGMIYKIQTLIIQFISSMHYTIVTNTFIISTYRLNSGRKYRSSCHQGGIKKEKRKDI